MTRLTFITIAAACCILSYYAGRSNPSDYHAAKLTAAGYDAGRQSVIDELPKPSATKPVQEDISQQCIAWWSTTNVKDAKKRFCSK